MLHAKVRATNLCECDLSTPTRSDLPCCFTWKETKFLIPNGPRQEMLEPDLGCSSPWPAASQLYAPDCGQGTARHCLVKIMCQQSDCFFSSCPRCPEMSPWCFARRWALIPCLVLLLLAKLWLLESCSDNNFLLAIYGHIDVHFCMFRMSQQCTSFMFYTSTYQNELLLHEEESEIRIENDQAVPLIVINS